MNRKIVFVLGIILTFQLLENSCFQTLSFVKLGLKNREQRKILLKYHFYLPYYLATESHSAQIHLKPFFLTFKKMVNGQTVYASDTLPLKTPGPLCPYVKGQPAHHYPPFHPLVSG